MVSAVAKTGFCVAVEERLAGVFGAENIVGVRPVLDCEGLESGGTFWEGLLHAVFC